MFKAIYVCFDAYKRTSWVVLDPLFAYMGTFWKTILVVSYFPRWVLMGMIVYSQLCMPLLKLKVMLASCGF